MDNSKYRSFLHARDPSIVAWSRPPLDPAIRMDLCPEFSKESTTSTSGNSTTGHLQVYLRIKPSKDHKNLYEIKGDNSLVCHMPNCASQTSHVQEGTRIKKTYSFTKIYNTGSTQKKIFDDCVKERVLQFLNGRNATLFTYGNSGSGKTYTILGTTTDPGIIPRSLEYIFRTLPVIAELPNVKPMPAGNVILLESNDRKRELDFRNKVLNNSSYFIDRSAHTKTFRAMQQRLSVEENSAIAESNGVSFGVWVSFAEVYNECVYDLLQSNVTSKKNQQRLRLGQDTKGNTYIKDLTIISVSSGLEAYELLQYGMQKLNYASTSVNSHSSRSHCIFTIKLAQLSSDTSHVQISHFNFCDLAGSERAKNTRNVGDRLKESHNINTSLHVLGRCITTIREKQRNNDSRLIPFRESKLTRLFQPALAGHEALAMIVNITTDNQMFDETQHVLHFSAIAKDVILESDRKAELITLKSRFSRYISQTSNSNQSNALDIQIRDDQITALCKALERQEQLAKDNEMEIRRNLTGAFSTRFNEINDNWAKRLKEQENNLLMLSECKIKSLEEYYKSKLAEIAKRPRYSSIIDLDSSAEDMSDDLKEELQLKTEELNKMRTILTDIQDRSTFLQTENTRFSFELNIIKKELEDEIKNNSELQKEVSTLRSENFELKTLLAEAEAACNNVAEREEQTAKTTIDFINMQAEVSDLTALASSQAAELQELTEEIAED